MRFLWKSKEEGEKRNENVRRGGKRKRKPGNRLDSRKGLSTFSHDTICCRHLTDNASAGAKYVFQLYLFPSVSFSLSSRPLLPSRNCQTIEVSRECGTACAVVWASSCSWIGLNSVWDEKGLKRRVAAHSRSRNDINTEEGGENLSKFFLYFSRFLLSFDFWIFSLFLYVTIKTIGRTLCLIIKYASMNYSFDFYFWNYIIALEICPFATFHRLLRVLNISFFEFPRAASDDYQLPEKE